LLSTHWKGALLNTILVAKRKTKEQKFTNSAMVVLAATVVCNANCNWCTECDSEAAD
jgi:2-iminoacetate synthase ThiH